METELSDIEKIIPPIQVELNINTGWVFISLFFILTTIIFLILFIIFLVKKNKLYKLNNIKTDYISALETTLKLHGLRAPKPSESVSSVYESQNKVKQNKKKMQDSKTSEAITAPVELNQILNKTQKNNQTNSILTSSKNQTTQESENTPLSQHITTENIQPQKEENDVPKESIASSVNDAIFQTLLKSFSEKEAAALTQTIGSSQHFLDTINVAQKQLLYQQKKNNMKKQQEIEEKRQIEQALESCGLDLQATEAQRILAQILSVKTIQNNQVKETNSQSSKHLSGTIPHI